MLIFLKHSGINFSAAPYDPTPSKRQVLARIKKAFRDKDGRDDSNEDET